MLAAPRLRRACAALRPPAARGVRNKAARPRPGLRDLSLDEYIKKDEYMLESLTQRLQEAKARLQREEKAEKDAMAASARRAAASRRAASVADDADEEVQMHHRFFWDVVLKDEDRKRLARYHIHSVDELHATHQIAESIMKRPPFPPLAELEPHLRFGHEFFESIPQKIIESRTQGHVDIQRFSSKSG